LDDGTEYDIPDGTPYEVFTEEVQEPPEDREPETQEPETQEPETREPEAREAPEDLEPAAEAQAPPPEDLEPAAEAEAPEAEAPAAETEPPGWRVTVIDEVKALLKGSDMDDSLRQDEQRRAKKIQIENSLLNRSRNLINLSEVLTKELLPSVMERMDVCVCPICTGNVLALALNMLPTKYVTTDEGKQYTQLEVYKRQNELDVMAALTRACLRVKGSPRHEIIDDLNE
jgi:competence protein ComFB